MAMFFSFSCSLNSRSIVPKLVEKYPPSLKAPVPLGADLMALVSQCKETGLKPVA